MKIGDLVKHRKHIDSFCFRPQKIGLIVDENIGKFNGEKMVRVMFADGTIVTRSGSSLEVI